MHRSTRAVRRLPGRDATATDETPWKKNLSIETVFLVSFVDEPRHIYGRSHSRARLRHLHAAERDRLRRVRARIVRVVYR